MLWPPSDGEADGGLSTYHLGFAVLYGSDVFVEVTLQSLEPLAGGFSSVLHLPLRLWLPVV